MQVKYTTNAKVKAGYTTSLSDEEIDNIISIVSANVDTYVGFKLATGYATVRDLLLDGSGTEFLVLPQPVCSYTSLKYVDISGNESDVSYISSKPLNEAYTLYFEAKAGGFGAGSGNYKIKDAKLGLFTIDFVTSGNHTLPYEIESSVISLVRAMIDAGAKVLASGSGETEKSGKIVQETIGSYSATYAQNSENFSRTIKAIPNASDFLNKYKGINII